MKKTLALVLIIIMLVLMCACSGSEVTTAMTQSSSGMQKPGITLDTTNSSVNTPNGSESTVNILHIDEFYSDLARIEADTGYGYIDKTGKIVIQPVYEEAQEYFDDKIAKVCKDGVYMFIDKAGNILFKVDFEYTELGDYVNGAFWIEKKEETISGAVYTMTYYKYDGKSVKEAFSLRGKHIEDGNSNFYMPDETKPNEKYALICIPEEDGYSENRLFIDFNGNLVNFEGMEKGGSIGNWHRNFAYIACNSEEDYEYYYIDFIEKKIFQSSIGRNASYIGYGKYINYGEYHETINSILKNVEIVGGQVAGTYIDISKIPNFSNASVCGIYCGYGDYYTVYLKSSSGIFFSSVIDGNGNVIIEPTKNISLGEMYNDGVWGYKYRYYTFSQNGFCKAKDEESGLFGFIDVNGNWIIKPKFQSVTSFSSGENPVAVVDGKAIINSKGEVICSFGGWRDEIITTLSGKYEYDYGFAGYFEYITFKDDNTFEYRRPVPASSKYYEWKGKYIIKGTYIIISDSDSIAGLTNGTHAFFKDVNKIIIGNTVYTLVE